MIGDKRINRALLCFGVTPAFYEAPAATRRAIFDALQSSYGDLRSRFGVNVLATLDDDRFMVGASPGWPWTCYMLVEIPDVDAVVSVCNILREATVGDDLLWKYLKVEARIGRELFFGRS